MNQSILRKLSNGHQTLGIEITDSDVKICEIQQKGKQPIKLLNYSSRQLPAGVVDDGKVVDQEKLHDTIKMVLDSRRFSSRYVHFAIPSQMAMVRSLKLPDLAHADLKKLVSFEMKNNLSMAFDDPSYDFIKLPRNPNDIVKVPLEEENLSEVLVVAAPTSILQDYVDIFERLKLIPCSIEIKSFSLLRVLDTGHIDTDGINIIVNVNELNSEFTIIEDGHFKITRNVEVSFKSITKDADSEQNSWLESFSSPEQTFSNAAQDLIAELERLMNFYYYNLNKSEKSFSKIILSGDIAELGRLAGLMAEGLTPPVTLLDWQSLSVADNSTNWNAATYAVPLGLALRGRKHEID